jgi:hypothetical protein
MYKLSASALIGLRISGSGKYVYGLYCAYKAKWLGFQLAKLLIIEIDTILFYSCVSCLIYFVNLFNQFEVRIPLYKMSKIHRSQP